MVHMLLNHQNKYPSTIRLSRRGREVFALILAGLTKKQIAERLEITVSGVRRHEETMLSQNNCTSMSELIARYHSRHVDGQNADQ
jgi:DNA-binding CsgD family transcriptional regulator